MVPHKIVSNDSRFKPALNLNRGLADFGGFKPRLKFFKFHLRLNMISGRLVSISILHRRTSKLLWLFRFNVIQAKLIFISILRRRMQLKNYCRLFIINDVKRFLRRNQKNGNINVFPKELSLCCTHWFYNLFIFATQCCRL